MIGFVVGHPRSGTFLSSELLNAAAGGPHSAHELLWQLSRRSVATATRYYLGRVSAAAVGALVRRYDGQPIAIDCNWKLAWMLPPLLERFPRARLVHLVRDPRDTIRSCFNLDYYGTLREQRRLGDDRFRDYWLKWMPPIQRPDWAALDVFEKNCAFWAETQRLIAAHAGAAGAFMQLRLEELGDPARVAALFEFFSLPAPPRARLAQILATRCNEKTDEKSAVARARPDILGAYPAWSRERLASFQRIVAPSAAALGYPLEPW